MDRNLGSDLAVVAAGILIPASVGQMLAEASASQGQPKNLMAGDSASAATGTPSPMPGHSSPWWLDAGAVTLGFTALAAGIGVIGKRILELWKDYLAVKDEHDAKSLAVKVEELKETIKIRDERIAFLDEHTNSLQRIVLQKHSCVITGGECPMGIEAKAGLKAREGEGKGIPEGA